MQARAFQGERLRLARLFSGLRQEELGTRVGVTRQFIHSLEVGAKAPSSELAPALALVLNVTPGFLFRPMTNEVREEQCHLRSRKTTGVGEVRQVIAHGTLFEMLISYLDSLLSFPKLDFPQIEAQNAQEIETAAEHCRNHWGLGEGPISNMCRVLENAGAVVTYFRGVSEKVDALSISRPRHIVVRNTAKASVARMRFDLAHECGHLVMHQGIETGDDITEMQADQFASAFLMPRRAFGVEFPRVTGRLDWQAIYRLKLRWKTSAAAILYRAKDLSLIDAVQFTIGNRYLRKSGQARHELYDDKVQGEDPELLKSALKTYESGFNKTLSDLANELNMTTGLLASLADIAPGELDHVRADARVVALADYLAKRSGE